MYRTFLREKSGNEPIFWRSNKYKTYRNKHTVLLRAADKGYYANNIFKLQQHSLHKVWQTINNFFGKNANTPKIAVI